MCINIKNKPIMLIVVLVSMISLFIVVRILYRTFIFTNKFSNSFKSNTSIKVYGIGNLIELNNNVIYQDRDYYYRENDEFFKNNKPFSKNCDGAYSCKKELVENILNHHKQNKNDDIDFEFKVKDCTVTYRKNNTLTFKVFENIFEYIVDDKQRNITYIDYINPIYFTKKYFYFIYYNRNNKDINYRLYRYNFSNNKLDEVIVSDKTNTLLATKENDSIILLSNEFTTTKRGHKDRLDLHLGSKLYRLNTENLKQELIFETPKKEFILGYHNNNAYIFKDKSIQKINIKTSEIIKTYPLKDKEYYNLEVYAIKDKLFIYDETKLVIIIDYNN